MLGVEMASTGEVGCFGDDLHEALLHAMVASGFRFPSKGVLLSLGPIEDKYTLVDEIRVIAAEALTAVGIPCTAASKHQGNGNSAISMIDAEEIDLIINIPREYDQLGRPDGYLIRRRAVEAGVPLVTDLQLARALIEALRQRRMKDLSVLAWQDYMERNEPRAQ
jgi:carbamoyl-phosphate synthase large subunit